MDSVPLSGPAISHSDQRQQIVKLNSNRGPDRTRTEAPMRPADPTGDGGWDGGTPALGLGLVAGIAMVGASSAGWNGGTPAAEAISNPPGTGGGGGGGGAHARCTPAMYLDNPVNSSTAKVKTHFYLWTKTTGLLHRHPDLWLLHSWAGTSARGRQLW